MISEGGHEQAAQGEERTRVRGDIPGLGIVHHSRQLAGRGAGGGGRGSEPSREGGGCEGEREAETGGMQTSGGGWRSDALHGCVGMA